jgi:hypothetical protein
MDLTSLFGRLSTATESVIRQTLHEVDGTVRECAAALTIREPYKWRVSGLSSHAGSGGRVTLNTYLENHAACLEEELTVEFELSTAGAGAPDPDGSWTLHVGVFVDGVFSQELAATLVQETYRDPVRAARGMLGAVRALGTAVPTFPQTGDAWYGEEPPVRLRLG